jgi:hypothetical protein
MKNTIILVVLVIVALVTGWWCYVELFPPAPQRTGAAAARSQADAEARTGAQYLVGLLKAGQLPGIVPTDHGRLFAHGGRAAYPYTVTFQLDKQGDPAPYHYTIRQAKKGAPWQLMRAWQADTNGAVLHEWPVQ